MWGVIFEKLFPVNLNFELDARNAWDGLLHCENVNSKNNQTILSELDKILRLTDVLEIVQGKGV